MHMLEHETCSKPQLLPPIYSYRQSKGQRRPKLFTIGGFIALAVHATESTPWLRPIEGISLARGHEPSLDGHVPFTTHRGHRPCRSAVSQDF